eukprot:7197852-Alexandrium_andersonii.AAC.1
MSSRGQMRPPATEGNRGLSGSPPSCGQSKICQLDRREDSQRAFARLRHRRPAAHRCARAATVALLVAP